MSLNSSAPSEDNNRVRIILRTADQYSLWHARVSHACWAATHRDVFKVSDEDCMELLAQVAEEQKEGRKVQLDWVGKSWQIITSSLK